MSSSMADVGAAVRAAIDACTRRRAELLAALETSRHARARLEGATTGSTHRAAKEAVGFLGQSMNELAEAATQADIAVKSLTTYLATVEGSSGAQLRTPSPVAQSPQAIRPTPTAMNPRRFDGEGMTGILPYEDAGTAEANLFFRNGKHNDQPLHATHGTTSFRPGEVKSDWQHTKPAQGHIEGNAAADMLHQGQTEAVLYLNVEPCDYDGDGCKDNTAHYLKPGSTMHIRVFDAEGKMRYRKRVTGTGEGLTDE